MCLVMCLQSSDCVLVVENDHMQSICNRLWRLQRPSFSHINRVIAQNLANILVPSLMHDPFTTNVGPADVFSTDTRPFCPLFDGVATLCAHPGYKLTCLKAIPQVIPEVQSYR